MADYDQRTLQPKWRWNSLMLWLGVPMYCLMLILSLSRFLDQPEARVFGVAIYAMFQIYAPTLGSLSVILVIVREVSLRNISLAAGLTLSGLIVVTSAVLIYWSMPLLLSV